MSKKKCSFNRQLSILKFSMIASLRGHKQGKGNNFCYVTIVVLVQTGEL